MLESWIEDFLYSFNQIIEILYSHGPLAILIGIFDF